MAKKRKWIQGAIKHPGRLTKLAKSQGMSVAEFCGTKRSGAAGRMCSLRKTLMGFHK